MEENYTRKIKICELLGATKFQKVVFKVEEIKFKVIKKVCPNFIKYFDKYCDYRRDKNIKKVQSEVEKRKIINHYRNLKLLMRKELVREQNRNYHMDTNRPAEFIEYLKINKNIHKNGLLTDGIALVGLSIAAAYGITGVIPLIVLSAGSAFINFQCINIQNYNIYRYEEKKEALKKLQEKRQKNKIKKYGIGANVIRETFNKVEEIPTKKDIKNNIQTQEEKEQIIALARATLKTNLMIQETKNKKINSQTTQQDSSRKEISKIDTVIDNIKSLEELQELRSKATEVKEISENYQTKTSESEKTKINYLK